MTLRGCIFFANNFGFIPDEYTIKSQLKNISNFLKRVYFAYCKMRVWNQNKSRASHNVCRRCEDELCLSFKGKKSPFRLGIRIM